MINDKQHIIQKVRAELTISSNERPREKSEQLKQAVQVAIQKLEPVLDNMAGEFLCRIDSLSVEFTLPNSEFDGLGETLEKKLTEKISELLTSQAREIDGGFKNDIEQVTRDQNFKEVVSYFLQRGHLPWWAEPDVLTEAEHWLAGLSANEWISLIKPLAQSRPIVTKRFVKQFSDSVVKRLIQKMLTDQFDSDEVMRLKQEIFQFMKSQKVSDGVLSQTKANLFVKIIDGILSGIDQKKLTDKLLVSAMSKTVEFTGEQNKNQQVLESLSLWLKESDDHKADIWIDQLKKLPGNRFLIADKAEIEKSQLEKKEISTAEFSNKDEAPVAVHAGVVILHPFLESLFKNLGFVEGGTFLNEAAQERAVCLLHYLATGLAEFPEHELLLPKFICGWPLDATINRFLSLTESEKRECESLLSSCIQYWNALKNTSINGLRENFLQRDGILKREEFGWSLYVEQKTTDILLEKLPWGLSVVKLKWMNEMLTVHWH